MAFHEKPTKATPSRKTPIDVIEISFNTRNVLKQIRAHDYSRSPYSLCKSLSLAVIPPLIIRFTDSRSLTILSVTAGAEVYFFEESLIIAMELIFDNFF